MGQTISSARVTEPITLPRIWNACQLDSSMPDELKRFNIALLADDMNKLGANIPANGTPETVCKAIHDYIPNAEKVCMVGKSASKDTVYKAAKQFNTQYGSRIPIFTNGFDASAGYRPVADVCDDMYSVQKRVYRALDNNTVEVKKKLWDSIIQLRAQQSQLDAEFNDYKDLLNKGSTLDGVKANVTKDLAMQQQVVNQVNSQLATLQSMYEQYYKQLPKYSPYMRNAGNLLNRVSTVRQRGGGNYDVNPRDYVDGGVVNDLIGGGLNLAIAMRGVQDCFANMNTSYEEYLFKAKQPLMELERYVHQKRNEALIDPRVRGNFEKESLINTCAIALVEQKNYITSMEATKGLYKDSVDATCRSNNLYQKMGDRMSMCSRDSMCAWINGACQVNDTSRAAPGDTRARYINYNDYTVRALGALRRKIEELVNDKTLKAPKNGQWVAKIYANMFEQLIVNKLFTDLYDSATSTGMYTNLSKLMLTRSADAEGIIVNQYMAHACGDMLKHFAKYLVNHFKLNVVDQNQDTLLAEAFDAYVNGKSKYCDAGVFDTKKCNVLKQIPCQLELEQIMHDYGQSREAMEMFSLLDAGAAPYVF